MKRLNLRLLNHKRRRKKKEARTDKRPSALKAKETKPQPEVPDLPTGELDSILEELQRDMENLKASRDHFAEVQQKIEEDDAVSKALDRASTIEESKEPITDTPSVEASEPPKEASVAPKEADLSQDAKKSAAEITMQILDAAKKAKEEVAREEAEEKEQAEKDKKEDAPVSEKLEAKTDAEDQPPAKEEKKSEEKERS